jgi:hypothetical protein
MFLIKQLASGPEWGPSHTVELEVGSGDTARVSMGGTGRPIVGRVVASAGLTGPIDWTFSRNRLHTRIGIGKPPFGLVPALSSLQDLGDQTVQLEADGLFRIEDVDAGVHQLHIVVNGRPAGEHEPAAEPIATAFREVQVPEMPGGRSDEPLDLGSIPVVAIKKQQAAPPLRQR